MCDLSDRDADSAVIFAVAFQLGDAGVEIDALICAEHTEVFVSSMALGSLLLSMADDDEDLGDDDE